MKKFIDIGVFVFLALSATLTAQDSRSDELKNFLHHRIIGIYALMDDDWDHVKNEYSYEEGYSDGKLDGKLDSYIDVLINFNPSN